MPNPLHLRAKSSIFCLIIITLDSEIRVGTGLSQSSEGVRLGDRGAIVALAPVPLVSRPLSPIFPFLPSSSPPSPPLGLKYP